MYRVNPTFLHILQDSVSSAARPAEGKPFSKKYIGFNVPCAPE